MMALSSKPLRFLVPLGAALLLGLVGLFLGVTMAKQQKPGYVASGQVLFLPGGGQSGAEAMTNSTYVQGQVQTYAQMANSPLVLSRVVNKLDQPYSVADLSASVSGKATLNTAIVAVSAKSGSPQEAALIANAAQQALIDTVSATSPRSAKGGPALIEAKVLSPAAVPQSPVSPKRSVWALGGLVMGSILGWLAGSLLMAFVAFRARPRASVRIPAAGREAGAVQVRNPGPKEEVYRSLAAPLLARDSGRVVAVVGGQKKEPVAQNLATILGEAAPRVIGLAAEGVNMPEGAIPWTEFASHPHGAHSASRPVWLTGWDAYYPREVLLRLRSEGTEAPVVVVDLPSLDSSLAPMAWVGVSDQVLSVGASEQERLRAAMTKDSWGKVTLVETGE